MTGIIPQGSPPCEPDLCCRSHGYHRCPQRQSERHGGSITTPFDSVEETYRNVIMEEPGVWSVEGTPADSVRAALGAVMAANPPDLIVSGANFAENTGNPAASISGTIHAAITGANYGIPAIAVSVGILYPTRIPGFQKYLCSISWYCLFHRPDYSEAD